MARTLTCRLDAELDAALERFATQNRLTKSQATRELLRQVLTEAEPVARGWKEGYAAGHDEVLREHRKAMKNVGTGP